jgi:hypothetical protein
MLRLDGWPLWRQMSSVLVPDTPTRQLLVSPVRGNFQLSWVSNRAWMVANHSVSTPHEPFKASKASASVAYCPAKQFALSTRESLLRHVPQLLDGEMDGVHCCRDCWLTDTNTVQTRVQAMDSS